MSETYDKENHWYGWNGGECPVHPETLVDAITDGPEKFRNMSAASLFFGRNTDSVSIIAFRITKLYREPRKAREWWIRKGRMPFGTEVYALFTTPETESTPTSYEHIETIHVREVLEPSDD